ncbi:MAG: hypothetical protein JW882_20875 [Deltaproteobacteria bacterium]|nr:hypothetical protein [Deltaproteobacteria bacterium]
MDKKPSFKSLIVQINTDLIFYCGSDNTRAIDKIFIFLFNPAFQLVCLYRISRYFYLKEMIRAASICEWLEHILYSSLIAFQADIGSRFRIAHPTGIVIGVAKIGNGVTIWQHVTIGATGVRGLPKRFPTIEDGVRIFAGAVVVGGINIGMNAKIGALAFINMDVPAEALGLTGRVVLSKNNSVSADNLSSK